MMKIMPSIASADPLALGQALKDMDSWPYLHIDIEDGNFVPNITFGMKCVRAICEAAPEKEIQVHLLVNRPEEYLEDLAKWGVDAVIAHIETLEYPMRFLNRCHKLGMKAGLAFNMKTPVDITKIFWHLTDQLLLMTSEPDERGEGLYLPALERVIETVSVLPENVELYADGGLTKEGLIRLQDAGVGGVVLGRLVFQSGMPEEILRDIEEMLKKEGR